MDKKDIIRRVFRDIVGSGETDEAEIRRLFAAGYVQKVDGKTLDLDGFIAHMRAQKRHIAEAETEFLALAEEGDTVFSNHIVRAKKSDGSRICVQVLAQFGFDREGKIALCDELTRLIEGSSADADIGSRQ
ncbi:Uncharacterised protein [Kingella potus]|uniref:Uncharacterized protein n=1 Tax=Kingella potus TaxID=265175 RepID=A0A377QYJ5_9NEIS|nr:nuclear transport factor 2 family protein [Kingella potus]UOP01631.1 nuclear transport factor 2 family protein [Kingella potus]STR00072.1 Uncharacterised protein [Kingella potus]